MSERSDDLRADRRFAWAAALAAEGDHAAAADLLEQVVEIAPGWAPAWAALGEARERMGAAVAARRAWLEVARLDPERRLGAALHLARLDGETPASMPASYVAALFDDYAPRFDAHLREALAYRAPEVLLAALERVAPGRRFARAFDLGCGTGLMGVALKRHATAIDGVDLSPRMVEAARRTGAYATLAVASLEAALAGTAPGRHDLAAAADVLVYVGDLAPVFAGVARVLVPGGLFAFTLQRCEAGRDVGLGDDLRFAHGEDYVRRTLAAAGLDVLGLETVSTRMEKGQPVPGLVATASAR